MIIDAVMVGTVQPFGPNGEPSAIRKRPVSGPVALTEAGLVGDQQAWHDHGGADKALLHYAGEHYQTWTGMYPRFALAPGGFGENLTTRGMTEETVCIGDRYRVSASGAPGAPGAPAASTARSQGVLIQVTQPRQPCWKLGHNAGVREIPQLMQDHAATGWYYRVITAGAIAAGAELELVERPLPEWTVARVIRGFYGTPLDRAFLEELQTLELLGGEWTRAAANRLAAGAVEDWHGRLYGGSPSS